MVSKQTFKNIALSFKRTKTRVDRFWTDTLSEEQSSQEVESLLELSNFIKTALILSHGNHEIERGFSINKECLIENLKEDSLTALRIVYDAVSSAGGLEKLVITKSMILAARNSNSLYKEALKKIKATNDDAKNVKEEQKRKKKQLKDLEMKRLKVMEEAHRKSEEIASEISVLAKQI